MVKVSLLIASVAALCVSVNAQIPDGLESIVQSIISNPSDFKSQIASLSAQATNLPTGLQGSVNSALAAASKTLDAIGPKPTNTGGSSAGVINKPVGYMAAAAAAAAIAAMA